MNAIAATLILATTVVAMSACALGWLLYRRRVHGAFAWWATALSLNAAALCLMAVAVDQPRFGFTASLLLPWPALAAAGLRRFDARVALPGSLTIDLLVGTTTLLAACAMALQVPYQPWAGWAYWALQAVITLYAGTIFWRAGKAWRSASAQALVLVWLALAAAALIVVLAGYPLALAGFGQIGMVTVGSMIMALAATGLSSQRTEMRLRLSLRRLQVLANTDMLTQVSNRRHFEELAGRVLQSDGAEQTALVLLDIDHFKKINDKLGHAAGDRALRLVSRSARELLRGQDLAGRHGGDEFALLLATTTVDEAMGVAQRLVAHIQTRSQRQALPRLSLSFGIVQPRRGEAIADALQRADLALYEAKRLGRSRAVSAAGDEQQPEFHSSGRLGLTPF